MSQTALRNYQRIEKAIQFINENFKRQPSLQEIAENVHVSPFHFQKIFVAWAGISPKKFMQYMSVEYAKSLLSQRRSTIEAAYETGLSGQGRLHDLFVKIEGMTPGDFKNGGAALNISYSFATSPFGKIIVAATSKGVCFLHFEEDEDQAIVCLKSRFPNALLTHNHLPIHESAISIFQQDWHSIEKIKLHLNGSRFQLKVWESLLKVPSGELTSYKEVAQDIVTQSASRAVGNAVATNPVAFLIPCHRVIKSSGVLGNYHWGSEKKAAIVGWEAAQKHLSTVAQHHES